MSFKTLFNNNIYSQKLIFTLFVLLISAFLMTLSNNVTIVDEYVHTKQIISFQNNIDTHYHTLTTFTTYHHVIAFIADAFDTQKLFAQRTINLVFSILMMYVFFAICGKLSQSTQLIKSTQFVFLPIIFPFFFLVYTDIFALLMILLMIYFYVIKKNYLSLIFATFSILVRQPSLMWFGLIPGMQLFYSPHFFSKMAIKKWLPWAVVGLAFVGYFIQNDGVALGDKKQHHITFNITNFYFLLLVSFAVYFPIFLGQYKKIIQTISDQKWIILGLIAGFPLYYFSFSVEHIYNYVHIDFFIRNFILLKIDVSPLLKVVTYLICSYSILAMYTIKLIDKKWNLIYLLAFISVIPMPLIEQRYYIVAISLWQLTRTITNRKLEYVNALWMALISVVSYYFISSGKIFL